MDGGWLGVGGWDVSIFVQHYHNVTALPAFVSESHQNTFGDLNCLSIKSAQFCSLDFVENIL